MPTYIQLKMFARYTVQKCQIPNYLSRYLSHIVKSRITFFSPRGPVLIYILKNKSESFKNTKKESKKYN